jgi:hypothetical protein
MQKIRNAYKIRLENLKRRDHLGDLHIGGRILNGLNGIQCEST